jgi:hypothetical protein
MKKRRSRKRKSERRARESKARKRRAVKRRAAKRRIARRRRSTTGRRARKGDRQRRKVSRLRPSRKRAPEKAKRKRARRPLKKKRARRVKGAPPRSIPAEFREASAFANFLQPLGSLTGREMIFGLVEADIPAGHRSAAFYTVGTAYIPVVLGKRTRRQAERFTIADVEAAARQDGYRDVQVLAVVALKSKARRRAVMVRPEFAEIRKGIFARSGERKGRRGAGRGKRGGGRHGRKES